MNKLTFGGNQTGYSITMGGTTGHIRETDTNKAKASYFGVLNNCALGTIKEKEVKEAKAIYLGISPKNTTPKANVIPNIANIANIAKENYKQAKANIKGINPKTTRPYTNNDCGLLTPLNPKSIERLRYINLTCYPFNKVYKMFYEAFHERKGLSEECFLYLDPPYPGTEKYYRGGFGEKEHLEIIELMKSTPFHCLLSIGGECELYLKELKDLTVVPVKVKYSTSANDQVDKQEYLIMNYNIKELPLMLRPVEQEHLESWLR